MGAERRRIEPALKAKAALAAVRGDLTMGELAGQFGVHPTQIGPWKKQLLDGAMELFSGDLQSVRLDETLYEIAIASVGLRCSVFFGPSQEIIEDCGDGPPLDGLANGIRFCHNLVILAERFVTIWPKENFLPLRGKHTRFVGLSNTRALQDALGSTSETRILDQNSISF